MRGIDLELVFDRRIGTDDLTTLQHLLSEHASQWVESLGVWMRNGDQRPIDIKSPGSLAEEVLAAAGWRGETYRRAVAEHGPGDERFFGSVELRGASAALTVVVSLDSKPLFRMRDGSLLLGNRVAFQLRAERLEELSSPDWTVRMMDAAAEGLRPVWGAARSSSEYRAKVMSDAPPFRAEGRDFSKYLPGLFWLNYFGEPYVELIGLDRLLTAPAEVRMIAKGVVVQLPRGPWDWQSEAYRRTEDALLTHIGAEYFFSKQHPDPGSKAPSWSS